MSFIDVAGAVSRLQATTDALAALGARLAIGDHNTVAPEIRSALDEVLAAVGVGDVADLDPQQCAMMAGLVRTVFAQSADLLDRPTRDIGWSYTDPALLEGQGRASMMMPTLLAGTGELGDVSSFLDIGTGVGLLAVSAARVWPRCTVVGIDVWKPSLDLARRAVTTAGLDDRIEIREQDVLDLDDVDRYDCVWLPSFFFRGDILAAAMPKIVAATEAMSRGPAMSPSTGMTRGTSRDRYSRLPSSSALTPGMRSCPSTNVHL